MTFLLSCIPGGLTAIAGILFLSWQAEARGEAVRMAPEHWVYRTDKVAFIEFKGKSAIKVHPNAGQVVLKDLVFTNGTIEFDVFPDRPDFVSLFFHRLSEDENEIVYLRTWKAGDSNAPDTLQYSPMVKGVTLWDLLGHYQSHCALHSNDWNHVKLVVSGAQLRVFVNDSPRPALEIPRLEGSVESGGLALGGTAYFANLKVRFDEVDGLPPIEGTDPTHNDNRYLRSWQVTQPMLLPAGRELVATDVPKAENAWRPIKAERRGLINLTREFGKSASRRAAWLRTRLRTTVEGERRMDLGFSDEVWVFLNGSLAFVDKNLYRQPIAKSPDGRCTVDNTSFNLPLKAGDNELIIGVANDFYGWGIVARLDRLDGLEMIR